MTCHRHSSWIIVCSMTRAPCTAVVRASLAMRSRVLLQDVSTLFKLESIFVSRNRGLQHLKLCGVTNGCSVRISECDALLSVVVKGTADHGFAHAEQPKLNSLHIAKCKELITAHVLNFQFVGLMNIWDCCKLGSGSHATADASTNSVADQSRQGDFLQKAANSIHSVVIWRPRRQALNVGRNVTGRVGNQHSAISSILWDGVPGSISDAITRMAARVNPNQSATGVRQLRLGRKFTPARHASLASKGAFTQQSLSNEASTSREDAGAFVASLLPSSNAPDRPGARPVPIQVNANVADQPEIQQAPLITTQGLRGPRSGGVPTQSMLTHDAQHSHPTAVLSMCVHEAPASLVQGAQTAQMRLLRLHKVRKMSVMHMSLMQLYHCATGKMLHKDSLRRLRNMRNNNLLRMLRVRSAHKACMSSLSLRSMRNMCLRARRNAQAAGKSMHSEGKLPQLQHEHSTLQIKQPRVRELYIYACPKLRLPYSGLRDVQVFHVDHTGDRELPIFGQTDPTRLLRTIPACGAAAFEWAYASEEFAMCPRGAGMVLRDVQISSCPKLHTAILLGCPRAQSFSIKCCSALQHLSLKYNEDLSVASIVSCTNLHTVHAELCGSLKELDLHGCSTLLMVTIQSCTTLSRLTLGHSSPPHPAQWASTVQPVRPASSWLSLGDLPALCSLTADDLGAQQSLDLAECGLLTALHLERCSALRELSLTDCTKLRVVHVGKCAALRDLSISNAPDLQELRLLGCAELAELPHLALMRCRQLTHLSITGSARLEFVCLQSPMLATLHLVSCKLLTTVKLAQAKAAGAGRACTTDAQLLSPRLSNQAAAQLMAALAQVPDPKAPERLSLRELDVSHCPQLKDLPEVFDRAPDLQRVRFQSTPVQKLPETFEAQDDKVVDPDNDLSEMYRDMEVARSRSDASRMVSALLVSAALSGLSVVASQMQTKSQGKGGQATVTYPQGVWGKENLAKTARVFWLLTILSALTSLASATWIMYHVNPSKGIRQVSRDQHKSEHFKHMLKAPERFVIATLAMAFFGVSFTVANYFPKGEVGAVFGLASCSGVIVLYIRYCASHKWPERVYQKVCERGKALADGLSRTWVIWRRVDNRRLPSEV